MTKPITPMEGFKLCDSLQKYWEKVSKKNRRAANRGINIHRWQEHDSSNTSVLLEGGGTHFSHVKRWENVFLGGIPIPQNPPYASI